MMLLPQGLQCYAWREHIPPFPVGRHRGLKIARVLARLVKVLILEECTIYIEPGKDE